MNKRELNIDFLQINRNKEAIDKLLDKIIEDGVKNVHITNIPSNIIEEMYGLDITDFNGWQCDWWSSLEYKGIVLNISGCAWSAEVTFSKDDGRSSLEDEDENTITEEDKEIDNTSNNVIASVDLSEEETKDFLEFIDTGKPALNNESKTDALDRLMQTWKTNHGYADEILMLDETVAQKYLENALNH